MSDLDDFTPTHPGFDEFGHLLPARTLTPSGARRVPPNESKPRLSAKKEALLEPVHAAAAASYDELEAARDTVAALNRAISDGVVEAPLEIDDSMVVKLTKLVPP
jgi:hypothetical protein